MKKPVDTPRTTTYLPKTSLKRDLSVSHRVPPEQKCVTDLPAVFSFVSGSYMDGINNSAIFLPYCSAKWGKFFESAKDNKHTSVTVLPPQIVLVGNKVDEERLRKVQVDAHCAFAKQHDLKAFYVSAKTGDSVTMMFRMNET
ncbi:hypothetical protein RB195_002125 [Necator americanus]|uniref:Ras family protein n=1 Tax=Necator americanus TaxID=51031 RepID=A0ABR1DHF7_NECAM